MAIHWDGLALPTLAGGFLVVVLAVVGMSRRPVGRFFRPMVFVALVVMLALALRLREEIMAALGREPSLPATLRPPGADLPVPPGVRGAPVSPPRSTAATTTSTVATPQELPSFDLEALSVARTLIKLGYVRVPPEQWPAGLRTTSDFGDRDVWKLVTQRADRQHLLYLSRVISQEQVKRLEFRVDRDETPLGQAVADRLFALIDRHLRGIARECDEVFHAPYTPTMKFIREAQGWYLVRAFNSKRAQDGMQDYFFIMREDTTMAHTKALARESRHPWEKYRRRSAAAAGVPLEPPEAEKKTDPAPKAPLPKPSADRPPGDGVG